MENQRSSNKAVIALVVIVLLVIAATVVIVMSNNKPAADTSTSTTTSSPSESSTSPEESSVPSNATFKDGTYSATGSYQTPGGTESIGVKVTLADNTITDATVTSQGKTGEAQQFQSQFISGFKSQVVGKKISEVNLSRVAGSSLTPGGFNSALSDIEKQAQA